jgi:hypothetical protein
MSITPSPRLPTARSDVCRPGVDDGDYDRVGLIIIQKSARAAQFRQQFQ